MQSPSDKVICFWFLFCLNFCIVFYLTVIIVGFGRADPKTVGMLHRETVVHILANKTNGML